MINSTLQWAGTACLLSMYILRNFFKELENLDVVAGVLGGTLYLIWTVRVRNTPQLVVNAVAITIGLAGLYKAWG